MKAKDFFQEHCLKRGIEGVNEYTAFNWQEVVSIMEAYAEHLKKIERLDDVVGNGGEVFFTAKEVKSLEASGHVLTQQQIIEAVKNGSLKGIV